MILNSLNGGNEKTQKTTPKGLGILTAALTATLFGSSCTNNKSPEPRQQEAETKIEITAPENKVPEQYNLKTAKFQNNTERKEKSIEKKPTQDEIDAQEAKERGVDVKWRVKQKTDLEEARKFLTKRAKKDFEDENYRKILRNIKEQYDDLKLKTPKDIQELFNELLEREAENPKAIFGEYAE